MANLKDTIVLGNLTVTGKINGNIQSSGGTSGIFGSGTSGYLTQWIGSDTIANGPQIGTDTTKFLNNKGEWAVPPGTTYSAANATTLGLVKSQTTGTTANRDYNVQVNNDGTMKVNVPWTDTLAAQGGYADYLTGFSGRNASITWGTLATGHSFITCMDTANGGSIAFADKSGQTSMQVDGFFYQNEGNYKVLDESGGTISDKLNFTYGGTRRLRLWADGEGANIRMTTPGNANNCYELDTYDNILRLYYSTDDGGGTGYKSLTLMDANGVTDFKQLPTYNGTNLVTATDLSNYVDKTSAQTISGAKTFTAANSFTNESLFTHATYAPTWKDIASGVGKSSCFTRGAFMQLITGQILLPNATQSDNDTALDTTANTLKFQSMTASEGQPVTTTIATLNSNGDYTSSGYVRGSYFTSDGACGMKLSGGNKMNLSGSGNVMYIGYLTATGANPVYSYVFCNGSGSTTAQGTVRAGTFTQTANNYPVVDCSGGDIKHIRKCTASEYKSLTKDSNTLYLVM